MAALGAELRRRGEAAGLAAVGIAPASPMESVRQALEDRKAAGYAATMQFTYRNPARSTDPGRALLGARSLVVGALWYGDGEAAPNGGAGDKAHVGSDSDALMPTRPRGTVARYASQDYYSRLRAALGALADVLEQGGWATRVLVDDNALVDRAAAHRAGVGWFGKNANILLPGLGSWCVLGAVVTDAPLPTGREVADGCGACRRCLRACPTGALVSPGVLDARRCLAWLLQAEGTFPFEYRAPLGDRIYGCDDCQETCPVNRQDGPVPAEVSQTGSRRAQVDLLEMLRAPDRALLEQFGLWYIARRDPRYLRRNALIVLANCADGRSPEVEEVLEGYLSHPDEMLRAHAVWAAARLGRRDLLSRGKGLEEEGSAVVLEELRRVDEVEPRTR